MKANRLILLGLCTCLMANGVAWAEDRAWFKCDQIAPLPDDKGFAGPFAGVSNGALVVAGGSNWTSPPWEGGTKQWHDRVFVLEDPKGTWKQIDEKLPRPIGSGLSITTPQGIVCIGGGDAERNYDDVFRLEWAQGKLKRLEMPKLPRAMASGAAAMIGRTIYVAGGVQTPTATKAEKFFWRIDLASQSPAWEELPAWPGEGRAIPVAGAQEGAFFLISGIKLMPGPDGKATREYLKDAYRFSPATRTWTRIVDVPFAVAAAPTPAVALGPTHLIVPGGSDDGSSLALAQKDHKGFRRETLAYHTITNTWTVVGEVGSPRAVSTLVPWRDGYVIPSGETRAGVRSQAVTFMTQTPTKASFGFFNYLTLGLYPLIMLAISYFVGKKQTSEEFFRGGQRIPWWAAGISIYATMLSSITYMAVPAKAYAADWSYLVKALGLIAITPVVVYIYLPFYRQLNVTSAYEYLEKRFNLAARWLGSGLFMIFQLGRTAIVLFLPSLALSTVTQIDIVTCILLMGAISILMTFLGGVESVVWTDVAQTIIFLLGISITIAIATMRSGLTVGQMIDTASTSGKFFGNMTWSWDVTLATGTIIVVGEIFANLIPYTASQDVVQRYLTTRDEKQAARAIFTNAALTIPLSVLFFAMGTVLFVFYKQYPQRLDPTIKLDQIFPLFMVRELPAGVAGLVVAGIFAAAQPTSNLNSMATAWVTDFYRRTRPEVSDQRVLKVAQRLTVLFGIMGTGAALLIVVMHIESVWDLFLQMLGLTGASLAGLFALGIFTRRAHGGGALVGAAASVVALIYVQQYTRVNFFLYGAIGILVCVIVGYLASLVLPGERKPLEGLTIFTTRGGLRGAGADRDDHRLAGGLV